jgi:hypothetical protein
MSGDSSLDPGAAIATAAKSVPAARPVPRERTLRAVVVVFGITTFAGAALLFLVQPMVARMILPRLGGSPSVWNTCMLFFQTSLLLGYLYSHLSTKWFGTERQAKLHAIVLFLPLLFLPLSIGASAPSGTESPVWWLLRTMTATVGVPFFVVSTSAPLLQRWFAALPIASARDPYFLYSASNLGSMLALLGYPFALERVLGVRGQTVAWALGYVVFALLVLLCGLSLRQFARHEPEVLSEPSELDGDPVTSRQRARWILLSLVPSSLLLGVTAHISTDLAAMPLLWVIPLALYLLTFVLTFSPRGAVMHRWFNYLAVPLVLVSLLTIVFNAHSWAYMPVHLVTFFCCAMVCHRALANTRPSVTHLTEFYLYVSLGGMLGGVFNTLIAPHVFVTVLEYPLMLAAVGLVVRASQHPRSARVPAIVAYGLIGSGLVWVFVHTTGQTAQFLVALGLGLALLLLLVQRDAVFPAFAIALVGALVVGRPASGSTVIFTGRSFFGVLRVTESADHSFRLLQHGSTLHGREQIPSSGRCEPTTYYHRRGPVGELASASGDRLHDVAVVGLGTGALACYSAVGQRWTFFEIDPLVERIARDRSLFTHLASAAVGVDVVIGDGRIKLQEIPAGSYDLLVVDAFSSDAIPVHLLTREAMQLYVSRLKADGVLAVHISNRYMALEPVVSALVHAEGLSGLVKFDGDIPSADTPRGRMMAHWVAIARSTQPLERLAGVPGWRTLDGGAERPAIWTDDYSNILSVIRLR